MDWSRIVDEIESKTGKSIFKTIGCRSQYVSDLKSGKSKNPGADFVLNLISKFNLNYEWLLTGEGEMFDSKSSLTTNKKIPLLRQTVSCGPGQNWEDSDYIEEYIEPLAIIPIPTGSKIYAFRSKGLSMVGAGIKDGDIILFDASTREFTDDLYVFALDGCVYCKLLKFDSIGNKVQIFSVQSTEIEKAELLKTLDVNSQEIIDTFHAFGRVLAWIHENRLMWR